MKPGSCGPGVLGIYPVIYDEEGGVVERWNVAGTPCHMDADRGRGRPENCLGERRANRVGAFL